MVAAALDEVGGQPDAAIELLIDRMAAVADVEGSTGQEQDDLGQVRSYA
jgi:hypothetical protein